MLPSQQMTLREPERTTGLYRRMLIAQELAAGGQILAIHLWFAYRSRILSVLQISRQSISQSGAVQRIASAPPHVRVKLNGVPTFLHSVYNRDFAWYAVELAGAMAPPRR
jgi:hypothetical protein